MKIQIRKNQYKKLVKEVFGVDTIEEQGETTGDSSPKSGTSSDGENKTNATKWESGVTRGPANQIANTKWSDIVGASLKRDKANRLTEQKENTNTPKNLTPILPDPSKLPLLQGFDLNRLQDRIDAEFTQENKTYAPNPVYPKNENLFDFIDNRLDTNVYEQSIKNYKDKKLSGEQYFKTFWGDPIKFDTNNYDVTLWLPSDNRSEIYGVVKSGTKVFDYILKDYIVLNNDAIEAKSLDDKGNIIKTYFQNAPSESTFKRYFPDYTIQSITEKSSNKKYTTWITLGDAWYTEAKLSRGGIRRTSKMFFPQIGYFYPSEGRKPIPKGKLIPFEQTKVVEGKFGTNTPFGKYLNDVLNTDEKGQPQLWTKEREAQLFTKRISFNNTEVPEGFNPRTYNIYLDQIKPHEWKIIEALGKLSKIMYRPDLIPSLQAQTTYENKMKFINNIIDNPEILVPDSYRSNFDGASVDYLNSIQELQNAIDNIDRIYKNNVSPLGEGGVFEFSYGINPIQREQYYKTSAQEKHYANRMIFEINQVLRRIENREDTPYDDYLKIKEHETEYRQWSWFLRNELNKLYKQKENSGKQLKNVFGYDYWKPSFMGKGFDEFWDDYGFVIQLFGNLIFILAGGWIAEGAIGIASIFRLGSGAYFRYIAPHVADATFNALVAAYQIDRGQNKEALLSLVCVLVPVGKYGMNIGKVSQQAAESLSVKISKLTPGFLAQEGAFEKLMVELTDEEIEILRNVMSIPRQQYSKLVKDLESEAGVFLKSATKATGRKSGLGWKLFVDEFKFEAGIPFSAGIANSMLGLVKDNITFNLKPEQWLEVKEGLERFMEELEKKNKENAEFAAISVIADPDIKNKLKNTKTKEEVVETIKSGLEKKFGSKTEELELELTNLMDQMGGVEELKRLKNVGQNTITQSKSTNNSDNKETP